MTEEAPVGWLARLRQGLSKSSSRISEGVTAIFTKKKLDAETLDELEELLIAADLGLEASAAVREAVARGRFDKEIAPEEIREALAQEIAAMLAPSATSWQPEGAPHVAMIVGVNGNGKTTTVGKLANRLSREGKKVVICAADTFRAAAVEQLAIWAGRAGCTLIRGDDKADPASVAYKALEEARVQGADVLLLDTAGRLQNQKNLMEELAKIIRVLRKLDPSAPHSVLQVLDATTGQNAHSQVAAFKEMVDVTGLIVTKLDGTAKAGVVVALAKKFGLPVHAIGVGEGVEDLRAFDAHDFARNLVGLERTGAIA
ncbi:MAG: signal recognition particle-docking protein FtsY [Alphaproteobacteria bacterium]|nr:signal recognition particle-docking protein FtsY [Alphaproteobacteria bacterium]